MGKKNMTWKTKGMNRDLSVSAFNPEFSFENRNLRLSTNEFNTLLSWVNEKGTSRLRLEDISGNLLPNNRLLGVPIGTAVINHQLIVFTTEAATLNQPQRDYIYKLNFIDVEKTKLEVTMLFGSNDISLKFNVHHPLETLVSFEAETIQKVYWTDGVNQPRVINIVGDIDQSSTTQFDFVPDLTLNEEISVQKMLGANGTFAPGVIQYAFTYYRKNGQESNIFHTTPLLYISHRDRGASPEDKIENAFKITIKNPDVNFDYLRIYSIQRTSINGTPIVKRIQDLSLEDIQGQERTYTYYANALNMPTCTLNGYTFPASEMHYTEVKQPFGPNGISITCYGEEQYDYVNADGLHVSIQDEEQGNCIWVTSDVVTYDGITAYWVFATESEESNVLKPLTYTGAKDVFDISYIDTGTTGETIDPTELFYKGGEYISAGTIEQKDGTLFLGDIEIKRDSLQDIASSIRESTEILQSTRTFYPEVISTGNYHYANQLTSYKDASRTKSIPCGGFKTNDYYRLGVQFQHKSGKWCDPIFIKDDVIFSNRPSYNTNSDIVTVPTFKGRLGGSASGQDLLTNLINAGYKKIRPVVVFPKPADRTVVCQGVVNPTLYTYNHRNVNKDLYAQASWFFRASNGGNVDSTTGAVSPFSLSGQALPYTDNGIDADTGGSYNPDEWKPASSSVPNYSIRQVEVQGDFNSANWFTIDTNFATFHSPDIEFNDQLHINDYSNTNFKQVGCVLFSCTFSDIDIQTITPTISANGSGFVHQSFTKTKNEAQNKAVHGIVSGLFYDDFIVEDWNEYAGEKNVLTSMKAMNSSVKWMVYLWNKNGALNNDINRPTGKGSMSSELKKKVVSNFRYSDTKYFTDSSLYDFDSTAKPQIFSSDHESILKFNDAIYKGNIDALLIPDDSDGQYFAYTGNTVPGGYNPLFTSTGYWWKTFYYKNGSITKDNGLYRYRASSSGGWYRTDDEARSVGNQYTDIVSKREGVRMKYKSTAHLAFKQSSINWNKSDTSDNDTANHLLPIVEIVQTPVQRFGGNTEDAFKENIWVPCGDSVRLDNRTIVSGYNVVEFNYSYGDTYYQRWDCLKTYAYTREDPNQVVEIGSFMLETHTNIDGRYDRNRGQMNNLNMSPTNFNLLNPVYSQVDNFFTYKIQDASFYNVTKYPNQITWSKTKNSGADVDLWTNVTMASTLELDGDKGTINKIVRFNDQLLCFQDTGISQILYNENTQIAATDGAPIEIVNSGKVTGKRYFSSTIGCANKWSIVSTPTGIYFADSNDKSIYLFNGQLNNLSTQGGFNTWCKWSIPSSNKVWDPTFPETNNQSPLVAYYDRMNQEILFINSSTSLAYSEKLSAFTSFYDYEGAAYFETLEDVGIWLNENTLWKHQGGDYCRFF